MKYQRPPPYATNSNNFTSFSLESLELCSYGTDSFSSAINSGLEIEENKLVADPDDSESYSTEPTFKVKVTPHKVSKLLV